MRLLLDTHIALWVVTQDRRLSRAASDLLADPAHKLCVSAVSLWEIAIKHALGRSGPDAMAVSAQEARGHFLGTGLVMVPVTPDQAVAVDGLAGLHGDPFDRLLLAQALTEPYRLVTADARLIAYGDPVIGV